MTDDDYDALSQKQLASIKRDMRISLEDAAVRATYKVMAELETEQEPVAWMRQDGQRVTTASDRHNYPDYETRYSIPLYTTPPQRTWVGLTDEEIADCAEKMEASDPTDSFWREFFRGIEAKLNEKNT